jgi:hypothetical protein
MKTLSRTLVPLFFAVAILCSSKKAHAIGPVGIEAGAQVGVGTNPNSDGPNPLGVGLGLRGGVTLFGGLYGGVKVMDYLGSTQDTALGSAKFHALQYGIDAGWGFKVLILTIRPQIGVGNATFTGTVSDNSGSASVSSSSSSLYLEPGVTALISLGLLYIGADINYLWFKDYGVNTDGSSASAGAMTVHGQIGVQF